MRVGIGSVPIGSCPVWRPWPAVVCSAIIWLTPNPYGCLRSDGAWLLANADGGLTNTDRRLPDARGILPYANCRLANTNRGLADPDSGLTNSDSRLPYARTGLTDSDGRLAYTDGGLANSYCRLSDDCIGLANAYRGLAKTPALAPNCCAVLGGC